MWQISNVSCNVHLRDYGLFALDKSVLVDYKLKQHREI